ncbi:hypothetical protein ACIQU4_27790 [Streptomyces sp. NPDC090741]|uniref:hypothetical protein n=1 Tax=Streptomyces sp. NPDC090741 TaxID=3365967 RepID=UPI00381CAD77
MALPRNSYTIAGDVLVDFTNAAGRDRLSVPSLATFLLRGYVQGTIRLARPLPDGGSAPRSRKDLALDDDLVEQATEKGAKDGVVSSSRLLEILFGAYNRGQITLTASGQVGGSPDCA